MSLSAGGSTLLPNLLIDRTASRSLNTSDFQRGPKAVLFMWKSLHITVVQVTLLAYLTAFLIAVGGFSHLMSFLFASICGMLATIALTLFGVAIYYVWLGTRHAWTFDALVIHPISLWPRGLYRRDFSKCRHPIEIPVKDPLSLLLPSRQPVEKELSSRG